MDSLKQRIADYVKSNQPITRARLRDELEIPGKALDRGIATLKELGLIYSMCGFGCFAGEDGYKRWLSGSEALRERGRKGGMSTSIVMRKALRTYPARISALLAEGAELSGVEIANSLQIDYRKISAAISAMVGTGELKYKGSNGRRVYSIGEVREFAPVQQVESVNVICQQCKKSAAMQRVLAVYGRAVA
ncbi:ArsR family transcriptional regulator [Salmonella enterica]|nr:ArsR family transcriptional regulator [Salmonella enterica]